MSSSPTELAVLVDVLLPAMGSSITEGTLLSWSKAVGDGVAVDETICEVSTDKVDTECPAPVAGTVAELLCEVGETVEVGTVIARIATGEATGRPGETAPPAAKAAGGRRYSPVVTRIAAVHGVDLAEVAGTGRNGRVTKADALAHVEAVAQPRLHSESPYRPEPEVQRAPRPAPLEIVDGAVTQPLSRMRKVIGEHMRRSLQTAAQCTTVVEADLGVIDQARRAAGTTYLPLLCRCVIDALRTHPVLNSTLEGDQITQHTAVHLGIAVDLGDGAGLVVPVIRDAQSLSVEGLAGRIKDVARRARHRELAADELQGGTFTVTNPGASGAIIATPIINQPQIAILDFEAVVRRVVVVRDAAGNESIAIRPMSNLCLSWDHRAMDGVLAAQFLTTVRRNAERWPVPTPATA